MSTLTRPPQSADRTFALAIVLLLTAAPMSLLTMHARYSLLRDSGFQRAIAYDSLHDQPVFTAWLPYTYRLSLMRADLTVLGILLPVAILLAAKWLPPRLAVALTALLACLTTAIVLLQWSSCSITGTYTSLTMLREAVEWGAHDPEHSSAYLFNAVTVEGVGAMATTVVIAIMGLRWIQSQRMPNCRRALLIFVPGVVVALSSWWPWTAWKPEHQGLLVNAVRALVFSTQYGTDRYAGATQAEVHEAFSKLTVSPPELHPAPLHGRVFEGNIVLFVLETAPYRCLPLGEQALPDFPALSSLRERAIVSRQHYTTFPNTSYALFSLLTSMYAPCYDMLVPTSTPGSIPSICNCVRTAGYRTKAYSSVNITSMDRRMLEGVGFEEIMLADQGGGGNVPQFGDRLRRHERSDRQIIDAVKHDIEQSISEDRRFAYMVLPQVGHAPWPSAAEIGAPETGDGIYGVGRYICSLQDAWLGEIVELLRRTNRLDKTIIVVVGDHGLRTRGEFAALKVGVMNDVTYHVPLLIFAGNALDSPQMVAGMSSHIDVAPTLLSLLGQECEGEYFQGTPLWNLNDNQRIVFFWAQKFSGYDGYWKDGRFFAVFPELRQAISATQMQASEFQPSGKDWQEYCSIISPLDEIWDVQRQWCRNVVRERADDAREK